MSSSSSSESDEAITIRQALYDAIGVNGWLTRDSTLRPYATCAAYTAARCCAAHTGGPATASMRVRGQTAAASMRETCNGAGGARWAPPAPPAQRPGCRRRPYAPSWRGKGRRLNARWRRNTASAARRSTGCGVACGGGSSLAVRRKGVHRHDAPLAVHLAAGGRHLPGRICYGRRDRRRVAKPIVKHVEDQKVA